MYKTESQIQSEIRKYIGRLRDVRVWRNNTGVLKDRRGIPVRFGLCQGSSDLIGILMPSGRLLAFEVKQERGRVSDDQARFLDIIQRFGGFACVLRSVEDAEQAIEAARGGATSWARR